jgi:rsbT co-antagonist protein RsbR
MEQVIDAFKSQMPAIIDELTDGLIAEGIDPYSSVPREQLGQMSAAAVGALQRDLAAGTVVEFPAYWEHVAGPRAEQGAPIDGLLQSHVLAEQIMDRRMQATLNRDAEARAWWSKRLHQIMHAGIVALSRVFIAAHEQIIRNQASQIRELSTPIIPIHSGVLVLPVVGAIDSYRAGQILETLLEGIGSAQADVVIIDITGVPVVDTGVGNYLLQAARAARLLGSQVVLVGISAEVAQTIVQLGVELAGIVTRANLQSGIEYALGLQGLAICPAEAALPR